MAVVYRTDGAWGSGQGTNLAPAQVDGNFYNIDTRVTFIEDNPVEPVVPIAINIEGSAFTMGLSNGEVLGPIAITMPMPTWRDQWNPGVAYNELDFFVAPDGGLGAVMIPHTSAATFDWGALDTGGTGLPVYRQLIGGSGTTSGISDLTDVALGTQADDDMLVWDAPASLWRNETPAVVVGILPAFGGSTGSTAGAKGVVPAPATGDNVAGKFLSAAGGWAVPAGGGGGSTSLAGLTDVAIASPANNNLLQYRASDGKWHNAPLATIGGTVTSVDSGGGLAGGPITTTGMLTLAPVATLNLLANTTAGSAVPAGVSLSVLLDAAIGSARGSILRRGVSAWTVLTPGTAGTYLKSGGSAADLSWDAPAGSGTVTSIATTGGVTGGPITGSGTISLDPMATSRVLANISGSTAAPSPVNVALLLDNALGTTQGAVLYRSATAWVGLGTGTAGQVLTTGGAAANPAWAAPGGLPSGATHDQLVYAGGAWTAQRPRYVIATFVPGLMTASQYLLIHTFSKAVTIPANFGSYLGHNSQGRGTANATGSVAIAVQKNGVAAGTITVAAAGMTATFTTVGSATISFAAGDTIALVGPATADATFINFAATLVGYET